MERRNFKKPVHIETREDGSNCLTGYAAVFYRADDPGTEFELWEGYVERIMPGAFDTAILEDDVRALVNHDANMILGRNKSGTLSLSTDGTGLRYEIDLPDTQVGRDTKTSIERGDIDGSSFAFIADSVNRRSVDGVEIREVTKARLYDVGPVVYPAYAASTADTRAAKDDYDERIKSKQSDRDAINCRLKLLTLED